MVSDKDFKTELQKAITYIKDYMDKYPFFQTLLLAEDQRNQTNRPVFYIASGLFDDFHKHPGNHIHDKHIINTTQDEIKNKIHRPIALLKSLGEIGIKDVYWRNSVLPQIMKKTTTNRHKSQYGDSVKQRMLLSEQTAMIDLYVSKASSCFIPTHQRSSFSFFVKKMKDIERKVFKPLTEQEVGESKFFNGWGL